MPVPEFLDYFNNLEDPRCDINKHYPVDEILLLTLCATLCGCDGWNDIEAYGRTKQKLLREFLPYAHGIPSDDTLRRFFRALDPKSFQAMFISWVRSLNIPTENGVIAVDGKTSRRSFDDDGNPLHLVSAFASEVRVVLGQMATQDKSNEITAIPLLLNLLDIEGATISIDAMGCQKEIAQVILGKKADYLLALKGNQGTLHKDVALFFEQQGGKTVTHTDTDGGHGRVEIRQCAVADATWLLENHSWPGLKTIVRIRCQVEPKGKKGPRREETRYYITSLSADPKKILSCVRSHWAIENNLHWVLDVSFNDDQSRIRKGNAPQNIAIIRHVGLNLLQLHQATLKRTSIKLLRKKAGWDDNTLKNIISSSKKV